MTVDQEESAHAWQPRPATDTPMGRPMDDAGQKELVDELDRMSKGSLGERMEIEFLEASPQRVVARMPVAGNTQPFGLLHGGASVVLAETVGSIGDAARR